MDQPVFANVQVPGTGAASPLVPFSLGNVVLKAIELSVAACAKRLDSQVDLALLAAQRAKLTLAIVNDADGGGKPQRNGALGYDQSIVRVANSPANHRVDVHMKVGVPGEQFQLLVEHLQALFRYFVRIHVVDTDLQVIEPGLVQCLDAV
jgi:hypothetical protein